MKACTELMVLSYAESCSAKVPNQFSFKLRIEALKGSIPYSWLSELKYVLGDKTDLKVYKKSSMIDIVHDLIQYHKEQEKQKFRHVDCLALSEHLLPYAIKNDLIKPIQNAKNQRWFKELSPRWKQLILRDKNGMYDKDGEIWAAPQRWGCVLVSYRQDKFEKQMYRPYRDWGDLLNSRLTGRVGFSVSSHEFIAIALQSLDLDINTSFDSLEAQGMDAEVVSERIRKLSKQVRLFTSEDLMRSLALGDIWVGVGSSEDLLNLSSRLSSKIVVKASESGTPLWADMWVVPNTSQDKKITYNGTSSISPLIPLWFEFVLQPARIQPRRGIKGGASPLLLPSTMKNSQGDFLLENGQIHVRSVEAQNEEDLFDLGYMPNSDSLQKSDFLRPLDAKTQLLYNRWLDVAQSSTYQHAFW